MLSILKSISNDNHHNNCNELTDAPYHHYQNDNQIHYYCKNKVSGHHYHHHQLATKNQC